MSIMRASPPIRIRCLFFSIPSMIFSAASFGVVFAIWSNRSMDCTRRALSVTPLPARELRTILVYSNGTVRHLQFVAQALRKAAHGEFRRGIRGLAGRGDDAEDRGEVDEVRLPLPRKMRQEGAGRMHLSLIHI